ncbi:MAG: GWxTD domain-containing protein [Bacteroidales bacterium]|nr:GWxTD domain-containing protein [Bacteroidales bacterium]
MKRSIYLLSLLVFLIAPKTEAKELQALFTHSSFYNAAEGPYVETYLKVFGPSAEYVKNDNGLFQASLQVTLLFKQNEKIVDFRKYNLLSSELKDTSGLIPHLIDQQRILLPMGVYQLELYLKDNHADTTPLEYAEVLALQFDDTRLGFSGFQFIESYKATQKENMLSKSGYDLVPYVGDFFPSTQKKLTFYTELYHADQALGNQEDFLFRYYIESFETNFSLDEYSKFSRQKAASVNPLLATIGIGTLPTGNYNLVVEARDKHNKVLVLNKIFFQKSNPGMQIDLSDLASVDVTATFAEKITDVDSLQFYVASLLPICNMLENQFARNVIKTVDTKKMQQFLFNFWKNRNEQDPEAEWGAYRLQVMQVETAYKTRIKHGYETDMGRVWLKYGAPDDVVEKKHEPNAYPYIMWHYYHLTADQNNRRFIFYNPHLAGTEYFLLHSDARGEIFNPYWQYDLYGRNTPLKNYEIFNVDPGYGGHAGEVIIR